MVLYMGNICMVDEDDYYKRKKTFRCSKCNDIYTTTHGRYSERRSCRFHQFNKDGFCIGCRQYKKDTSANCYHY